MTKEELLGSTWGTGLDGIKGLPIIPLTLSTVRCGKSPERWIMCRAILVRQRNIQERRFILRRKDPVPRLNELIEACNRALDLLEG